MRGHEPLLDMRREGFAPTCGVYVDTSPANPFWACDWVKHDLPLAFVDIAPEDNVAALDLRFAVGLYVTVAGEVLERVQEVAQALIDAGAATVHAMTTEVLRHDHGDPFYAVRSMVVMAGEVPTWPAH